MYFFFFKQKTAYEIVEQEGFEVILVNESYAKEVDGSKADVSDAAWMRQVHSYGLLRGSFRPDAEIATLRAYLRQRERLVEYAAAHIQHMQKALMEMNLQLHHVVSDITGATGMRIIRAIVAGERNPAVLATYRDVRCHSSIETIRAALVGNNRDEHLFALTQSLGLYDTYQAKVLSSRTRRSSSRAAALLRLAATTIGRSDTALGAFYRRLSSRAGKAKAVTATARKIAVLFYNTLRHGMTYRDPGADHYEEQYRSRVLANLKRRAKSLGFVLQAVPGDTEAAVS